MDSSSSEAQIEEPREGKPQFKGLKTTQDSLEYTVYALALAVSISVWFLAIRAPLGVDESCSYWQISAGLAQIWPRQFLCNFFPAHSYILWLWAKLLGNSEIVLRIPSILAMLGAVYLLYRIAREFFGPETALFAAAIFCLHPVIRFAAIGIRPYAFGALAINAAIFTLIRLRKNDSNRRAALFGLSAAGILWFQYLFAIILPALALCFFALKAGGRKAVWRQFGVALAAFLLAALPTIPGWLYLLHTREAHAAAMVPDLATLIGTIAPGWLLPVFIYLAAVALLLSAFRTQRLEPQSRVQGWQILVCVSLALIPLLILYGASVGTSMRMFEPRYRLVAIPGIALCWGFVLSRFNSHALRTTFCVAIVAITYLQYIHSPTSRQHEDTWKYAVAVARAKAATDNAAVLVCSDYVESNFVAMPFESPENSYFFAPLSYYKLNVPFVPLPVALNDEAIGTGSHFLRAAAQKQERFLLIGNTHYSSKTFDWMAHQAAGSYDASSLGTFEGIEVVEFIPRIAQKPDSPGVKD